jgi:hypothetical protein
MKSLAGILGIDEPAMVPVVVGSERARWSEI